VVTGDNATQSGLSTPGGHLFAMEDSPSGPMMKMGASTGCSFTLGEGDVSGAHLRTDKHMQLASSSYKHQVPGVYKLSIGGGEPPKALSASSDEAKLISNFNRKPQILADDKDGNDKGDSGDKPAGASPFFKVDSYVIKKTVVGADLTASLSGVKGVVSATGLNVNLGLNALDFNIKFGGFAFEYVWNAVQYKKSECTIDLAEVKIDKSIYKKTEVATYSANYIAKLEKSDCAINDSVVSHEICVGGNTIVLTSDGVIIKSNGIVHINADLHVTGEVLVGGSLSVSKSIYVDDSAVISNRVRDSVIGEGVPIIPNVLIDKLKSRAPIELKEIIIKGAASRASVKAAVTACDAMAAPLQAAGAADGAPAAL
jgi:type VI secretion system secreted protein VgrG